MGWRDFQATTHVDNMDNMDFMPAPVLENPEAHHVDNMDFMDFMPKATPLNPYCPFNPPAPLPPKGAASAAPPPYDWQPPFKAWLQGDVLMTSGACDDLAGEIIKLTANDLPLQRRLLKLHCGIYSGPWWGRLVERWQERAGIMQYDGGLSREDAEYQAAECLRAVAFLKELLNNKGE